LVNWKKLKAKNSFIICKSIYAKNINEAIRRNGYFSDLKSTRHEWFCCWWGHQQRRI